MSEPCWRCEKERGLHWLTRDGYPVCPDLVRPDVRGEPEWHIEVVLRELKAERESATVDAEKRCTALDSWGDWNCVLSPDHEGNHLDDSGVFWNYPYFYEDNPPRV